MSQSLYQDVIKKLAQADHGHGRLASADGATRLDNPLCGDRIDIELKFAGDRVAALAQITRGCLLCRAAASLLGLRAPGQRIGDLDAASAQIRLFLQGDTDELLWPEFAAFAPVRNHHSRRGCVLLPFDALQDIVRRARL